MKRGRRRKRDLTPWLVGLPIVVWLALRLAPSFSGGLLAILNTAATLFDNPLEIIWTEGSLRAILAFCGIYALVVMYFVLTRKHYRRGEEHGSADWGDAKALRKVYAAPELAQNKILTKDFQMGLDGYVHQRNLNTLVVGGSGAGKTRSYIKPNVMQANSSMVILDPKGEILRATGHLLEAKGFKVKALDLIDMDKSYGYNPFVYLGGDNDIQRVVTNLFAATTPKGSQSQDPFWDTAAQMLLLALMFYLYYKAPAEEQNFPMVMDMLRYGEVKEDDDSYMSPLDILFERLEMEEPGHIALKYYKSYRAGSGKTLKSIQITLAARLEKFNLESLRKLTAVDELELEKLGTERTAVFAIIPDNDSSFNFIVSMLYTQLFQRLYYLADHTPGGRLPVPVQFFMDEFANVTAPPEFEKLVATMRSRDISVTIVLQNMAQLEALFKEQHKAIAGNCDTFLYLGANEADTNKYISELLGKATIDTNTYGHSRGRNGSFSTNDQNAGRELMTPDEVRRMNNKYAILFVRGEKPLMDLKYNLKKHPNIHFSADGKGKAYQHGQVTAPSLRLERVGLSGQVPEMRLPESGRFEILSGEELEEIFELEEKKS